MKKEIDPGVVILIVCLIGIIVSIAVISFACNYLSEEGGNSSNSNSSDVCGICGGSGVVTFKSLGEGTGIQKGFDTYYRCKGCHGSGIR